jgi:Na+/H+ antiporter NhaD/arsenite permease-like protein
MKKVVLLLLIAVLLGALGRLAGLTAEQAFILSVFSISISGTLLFWDLRLGFVFVGSGMLFLTRSVDLEHFIEFASIDVILFLIGMMIVIGAMKEAGVFAWLVGLLLQSRSLGGVRLFVLVMMLSAALSGLTGEVTSIIVMVAVILDICKSLKIDPAPLVISSVLTTNIGSASTLLGNPIGILIALRGGLTFEDFLMCALPLSILVLGVVILILLVWYRDYIKDISSRLADPKYSERFIHPVSLDSHGRTSVALFGALIVLIAMHKRLGLLFGIAEDDLLIILPVIFAGLVMFSRPQRVRSYIEKEVEWASLLFFMFLFAQAGVIQSSGVAELLAHRLVESTGSRPTVLAAVTLFSSGLLSGVLDNTVVVASFIPVVKNLHLLHFSLKPLWWCLLFGACFGGNITAIGSTANIVALGVLEKELNKKVDFVEWLKLGLIVGVSSLVISYVAILLLPMFFR